MSRIRHPFEVVPTARPDENRSLKNPGSLGKVGIAQRAKRFLKRAAREGAVREQIGIRLHDSVPLDGPFVDDLTVTSNRRRGLPLHTIRESNVIHAIARTRIRMKATGMRDRKAREVMQVRALFSPWRVAREVGEWARNLRTDHLPKRCHRTRTGRPGNPDILATNVENERAPNIPCDLRPDLQFDNEVMKIIREFTANVAPFAPEMNPPAVGSRSVIGSGREARSLVRLLRHDQAMIG